MTSPNERLIQEITKMAQNPWDHYSEKIEGLLRSNVYTLDCVSKTRKDIFRFPGVYLITCQDDSEIVWVGKTTRKRNGQRTHVKQRIQAHKAGYAKSDLRKQVGDDCLKYNVRAVCVTDDRERMLLEHFLIGVLKPQRNVG